MKRCLHCFCEFESGSWQCPSCGQAPPIETSIPVFAPDLAYSGTGFTDETHETLDRLQSESFWFRARNRLITALLKKHCRHVGSILEIGCGTGFVLSGLSQHFPTAALYGSEIDLSALNLAKKRLGGKASFAQMDALAIPFTNEFDCIAACDVLEHIERDETVLREISRALKSKGYALLTVPQHPWLWSQADDYARHKRRYKTQELTDKVSRAGFRIIVDTSFVVLLLPLMALQRLWKRSGKDYNPTSELSLPSTLNVLFERMLDWETNQIIKNRSFPFGGSRYILAQRK